MTKTMTKTVTRWLSINGTERQLRRMVSFDKKRARNLGRYVDHDARIARKWDRDRLADLVAQVVRRPLWSVVSQNLREGRYELACGSRIRLTFQTVRRPVFRILGSQIHSFPRVGYEVYGRLLPEGRFFEWNYGAYEIVPFLWACERRAKEMAAEKRTRNRPKRRAS